MSVLLRMSRIRNPRATLGSSVLLIVAFSLFGVWADSSIELEPTPHAPISFSEQIFMQCSSNLDEEPINASTANSPGWRTTSYCIYTAIAPAVTFASQLTVGLFTEQPNTRPLYRC